ncbi:hypothetical protein EMIT091MI3_90150 [Kosakonia quasisacchari]
MARSLLNILVPTPGRKRKRSSALSQVLPCDRTQADKNPLTQVEKQTTTPKFLMFKSSLIYGVYCVKTQAATQP